MSVSSVCFFPFLAVTGGSLSLTPTGGVWNAVGDRGLGCIAECVDFTVGTQGVPLGSR